MYPRRTGWLAEDRLKTERHTVSPARTDWLEEWHIVQRRLWIGIDPIPKLGIEEHPHHDTLQHRRAHRPASARARAVLASTAAIR